MNLKSNKKFYILFSVQILAIILIVSFFLIDFERLGIFEKNYNFVTQNDKCDLTKNPCTITLNKTQKITLSISPKGIPLMKPLNVLVKAKNIKEDFLNIKFYATNMDMGVHKLSLKRTNNDTFNTSAMLPTCITGGMIWNADITSGSFLQNKAARFSFKTK